MKPFDIFSIRDVKTGVYKPPFIQSGVPEASRSCMEIMSDKNSLPAKYPEDFHLERLGTFDSVTGVIEALPVPVHILKFSDFSTQQ